MLYFPVIIMGASSIILQILCLRQLLATFSGNELIIGITLAVWLVFVAVGSWSGSKLRFKNAFGWSFLLVSLLSQATILFIKVIRPMTGFGLGEVIPLPMTILWTVFAMSALCISIGTQFPLAVSYLREKAADVYSLEAAGAFAGGACFTFFLAGNIDIYKLVMLTAIINIFVSFYLLRKKAVLLLFTLPVVFYYGSMNFLHSHQHKGIELIKRSESRYGEIMVLKTNDQLNIYSSEKFQFSYPDPQAEEMKTHLPMSLHPDAGKILVVGGSPAVIREFLKYPVSGIDFVEIDPAVIEISRELLSREDREYLNDPRVKIFHIDARRYIKSLRADNYDLIVLNIPEPSTANVNRYYTREFFSETKSALKGHGLLFMSLPVSYGYISRRMQTANGSVYASLKEVFPYVGVSSEEYGIILASDAPVETDPDALTGRFLKRGIDTKYFRPYILKDAFSPLQVSMVKGRLGRIKELNTDRRPVSYLYNLMLWSEIHGGKWLNPALGLGEYEIMIAIGIVLMSMKQSAC
ncbi:MAG: hypothetical protein HY757_09010 [Nitrospirae bacterium]|nr:hypothetical protein [Nitrospirota bacterium]